MTKIKVILASTRPERFGAQPARWIMELAASQSDATFELIDLAELQLPPLDEPKPAASGEYSHEHTQRWAKIVDDADGFVIVTPEYNHSYPASLKNAIDYVAAEWNYKPVAFVSYGAEAGGTRAVEHLRSLLAQLRVFDLAEQVLIPNYWTQTDEDGTWTPTDHQIHRAEDLLKAIAFWAAKLKPLRAEAAAL